MIKVVDNDIETLAVALYVKIDACSGTGQTLPRNAGLTASCHAQ